VPKETWKDYYYKHFKRGVHDNPRKAIQATYDYQEVKIENINAHLQDVISVNDDVRRRLELSEVSQTKLLEAISWFQLFLAPGGKPYMLEKAEECIKIAGVESEN